MRTWIYLLSLFLSFSAIAKESERHLFFFNSPSQHKKFSKQIEKSSVKILINKKSKILLAPKKNQKSLYQKNIQKLIESKSYHKHFIDQDLYPKRQNPDSAFCQLPSNSLSSLEKQIERATEESVKTLESLCTRDNCQYSEAPLCSGQQTDWGITQIAADLADEVVAQEVEKSSSSSPLATVAVLDTGFDRENRRSAMEYASLETFPGHEHAGDPNRDESGHGTAVSSMIAGRNIGVTQQANLHVYRVTQAGDHGKVSGALIGEAIIKACQSADVVNVSWGGMADEAGLFLYEYFDWYQEALDRGCLVVRAAGNMGVKEGEHLDVKLEDPFIMVAANNVLEQEADFSTQALISAPGEGVYVYKSEESAQNPENSELHENDCLINGQRIGPINGTSFASPAAAGVATQIITVLRARGTLPENPRHKIQLVKSILLASQKMPPNFHRKGQGINALAAVTMARGVQKNKSIYTQDELVALAKEQTKDLCQEDTQTCPELETCDERVACIDQLRSKFMLCDPDINTGMGIAYNENTHRQTLEHLDQVNQLYHGLMCFKQEELALHLLLRAPSDFFSEIDEQSTMAPDLVIQELWESNKNENGEIQDAKLAMDIIELSSSYRPTTNLKEKIEEIISSFSFEFLAFQTNSLMDNPFTSSSRQSLERMSSLIKKLNDEDFSSLIEKIPFVGNERSYSDAELLLLYYLKENKDQLSRSKRIILEEKLNRLVDQWIQGDFESEFNFSNGLENAETGTFQMMMELAISTERDIDLESIRENPSTPKNEADMFYLFITKKGMEDSELERLAQDILKDTNISERLAKRAISHLSQNPENRNRVRLALIEHIDKNLISGLLSEEQTLEEHMLNDSQFWGEYYGKYIEHISLYQSGQDFSERYDKKSNFKEAFKKNPFLENEEFRNAVVPEITSALSSSLEQIKDDLHNQAGFLTQIGFNNLQKEFHYRDFFESLSDLGEVWQDDKLKIAISREIRELKSEMGNQFTKLPDSVQQEINQLIID